MVEWFDETVGELLGSSRRKKLADDTIVVYLADNGWIQNRRRPALRPQVEAVALRRRTAHADHASLAGQDRARASREALALSIDLAPTLLDRRRPATDRGDAGHQPARRRRPSKHRKAIFGECFTHNAVDLDDPAANLRWRWMIEGDWKLIVPDPNNEPQRPGRALQSGPRSAGAGRSLAG